MGFGIRIVGGAGRGQEERGSMIVSIERKNEENIRD